NLQEFRSSISESCHSIYAFVAYSLRPKTCYSAKIAQNCAQTVQFVCSEDRGNLARAGDVNDFVVDEKRVVFGKKSSAIVLVFLCVCVKSLDLAVCLPNSYLRLGV
ncbi:hypothetical protein CEXT_454331, partial [Caerostris extrusa]